MVSRTYLRRSMFGRYLSTRSSTLPERRPMFSTILLR
ncbi:Uncharacterised protein [Mycobacteroides abscessus subsp. abscessus]|nr:Uncharacterised protein [Mycobacteroides abscessus subsp. abscessus]SKW18978.1 Uncharacterised protein [Mycobacteroides abscessus subsp. abscessus]